MSITSSRPPKSAWWVLILALIAGGVALGWVTFAYAQQAVKPVDKYGNPTGTASNPLVVTPSASMMAPTATPGAFPGVMQSMRLLGGPLNTPIGMNGDRMKVDPTPFSDACMMGKKTDAAISQTASTRIVVGVPGLAIYVCAIRLVVGAAEITSEWEGTGTNCGTGTIAHSGSTTAANGESFAANGGYVMGDGNGTIISLRAGNDFCIAQNGANRVSGKVSFVYAP